MPPPAVTLMNLDLIAVQLSVGGLASATVYCGSRRARQLLEGLGSEVRVSTTLPSGLGSVERRDGASSGGQTRACKSTIARNVAPLQSG